MTVPKVLLITGASSGFGRAFCEAGLTAGHIVIGTVRREEDRAAINALSTGDRAKTVLLDVTDFDAIGPAVERIEREIAPVDVLINSAGYGHEGVLEESSLEEMRRQFDVNLFGAIAMIKAVLPSMRQRRTGHIINITSMAGYIGLPGIAYYTGSKFALEGMSDVLAKEVAGFGVKVTAIAPGSFRTDWAGRSMMRSPRVISDYDALFDPVRRARQDKSGKQRGDPKKAAQAVMNLIEMEKPPVHLLLGSDALQLIEPALQSALAEIDVYKELSLSTDFDRSK